MQSFVSQILAEVAGHGRYLVLFLTALLVVLVLAVTGLGFLTLAAYLWLAEEYGLLEASVGVGGFFIVTAALASVAAAGIKHPDLRAKATPRKPATSAAPRPAVPTPAAVESVLKALNDGGHTNERLAVLAMSEAIRNARPMQLILTGLIAGFAGGQLLKRAVKPRQ